MSARVDGCEFRECEMNQVLLNPKQRRKWKSLRLKIKIDKSINEIKLMGNLLIKLGRSYLPSKLISIPINIASSLGQP